MTQEEYEDTINTMLREIYAIVLPLQDAYTNSRDWVIGRGGCIHIKEDVKANTFMPKIRRILKRYADILELDFCHWNRQGHYISLTIKNRKEIKQ